MPIDPTKLTLVREQKHETPLLSCAYDPTGRFVLAGGRDAKLVCLDLAKNEKQTLDGHAGWIGAVVRAGAESTLSADQQGRVIAWNCAGELPVERWRIEAHSGTILGLAASADGERFATSDRDGVVRVWRTTDGERLHELPKNEHPTYAVAWHADGKRLFVADRQPQKPRLKAWDWQSSRELWSVDVPELSGYRSVEDIEWGGIRGLAASPEGRWIVAVGRAGYDGPASALVYDAENGKLVRKLASTLKGFCYAARFHAQGFFVAAAGDVAKGEFRVWNPEQDASLHEQPAAGPCQSLDIHPGGAELVVVKAIGKQSYPDSGELATYRLENGE